MNETVQPETDATAEPKAEETSQQDDGLDSLLNDWDTSQEAKVETPPPTTTPDKSHDAIVAEVRAQLSAENAYDKFIADFGGAVADLQFEVSPGIITGWMNDRAKADPRINSAYLEKDTNPIGWSKVFAKLTEEFKGQFKVKEQPSSADADREAASAFVRGSSTKVEPESSVSNSEVAKMTDKEFQEFQRKLGI